MAFMLPMLEMCAPPKGSNINHSRFVSEILYLYRTDNPLNVFRTHAEAQKEAGNRIAAQKPYAPLDEQFYQPGLSMLARFISAKYG